MTRRVDLRSDTVTQPTQAMRDAMAVAVVGDDGYNEDPTVRELEERFAQVVGKESAVFVPSGVMGNQIAVRVLTDPGDLVIAGRAQHVVSFEMGAASRNSSIQFATVDDTDGALALRDVLRHHRRRGRPSAARRDGGDREHAYALGRHAPRRRPISRRSRTRSVIAPCTSTVRDSSTPSSRPVRPRRSTPRRRRP